ncbi:MAG: hypothetical protein M1826_005432, partial [Phylliscum demangeonii]
MGTPPTGPASSRPPAQPAHEAGSRSSKRRNTVNLPSAAHPTAAASAAAAWTAAQWPAVALSQSSGQPILVPLYSPLWPLGPLNGFHPHALLPGSMPFPLPPYGHAIPTPSRPSSPHRRGRPRARSPATRLARDESLDARLRHGPGEDSWPAPAPGRAGMDRMPSVPSHHSNSVPTTPRPRPRKCSWHASRSPPADGRHSPRSVHSDSNRHLPTLRKTQAGCRFETAIAFPRRRMHYSIGGDPLDRVPTGLKSALRPDEETKLTGDMRALYDRLLPSAESEARRTTLVRKLDTLLNQQWPQSGGIEVRVFGSSGNLLCTSDSDVDICIVTPMKALERVCVLADVLAQHGMERVVCVAHAKVPIVKMWDPELHLAVDLNVNNTLALENTRMIKTYVEIDGRVRPLAMIVKHWTKRRILNEAAFGGTLSSYTWICMILNFLQTRQPPILPCLHQRPHQKKAMVDGVESSFADDVETLRGFGHANSQTLGDLLLHFFRYYAYEVDYETEVISVRQGKLIAKQAKGWHLMQNNRIGVEEPFNVGRNLGNTADDTSARGIHLELRRAFGLIADEVDLAACCAPYEFPIEERPAPAAPAPRPLPSRSSSQSGRGRRPGA